MYQIYLKIQYLVDTNKLTHAVVHFIFSTGNARIIKTETKYEMIYSISK